MFYRLMLPFTTACLLAACGQNIRQPEMPPQAAPTAEWISIGMMSAPLPAKPHKKIMRLNKETAIRPAYNERYGKTDDNPVYAVAQTPVSTFGADVDTGSYANVRRFLQQGSLPPADAVRVEELVNYFDYGYPQPTDGRPFAVHTETVASPWQPEAKIIKIGIQAKELAAQALPPANLVFLVDISGSMNSPDKLPLVKQTLHLLTERLRPQDKVTLITYASGEQLVLPPTSGQDKDTIRRAVDRLQAGGATAGESAIQMAYREAKKSFMPNGINRILLATDGDFNVGVTDFNTLKNMVAEKRRSGISLTTLGFGTGNYNEHLMEQLADAGDGNYSYIDNRNEAEKVLQRQLSSTLATVAQDVKIQVEFNPATVKEYRLVGYENRLLREEDFNNDRVDSGDIGAGHSVTAFYEIIPVGKTGWLNETRYRNKATASGSKNEYAWVKLRYKRPNEKQSLLIERGIAASAKPLDKASADTCFALAVAAYSQQLRGGRYNGAMQWPDIIALAHANTGSDRYGLRKEFVRLAETARNLSSSRP